MIRKHSIAVTIAIPQMEITYPHLPEPCIPLRYKRTSTPTTMVAIAYTNTHAIHGSAGETSIAYVPFTIAATLPRAATPYRKLWITRSHKPGTRAESRARLLGSKCLQIAARSAAQLRHRSARCRVRTVPKESVPSAIRYSQRVIARDMGSI